MSKIDGGEGRLGMLDEFGVRQRIIPAEVTGFYRRWRVRVHFVLLAIFVALPWIPINGTQAVLLDVANRRFEIFGQVFMSHDSPIIFFFLALFAVGLVFTTAVWGRVWCGWACPQTVFIDAVYRRIELWAEGDYIQRRKLAHGPMTANRILRLVAKWFGFFVVSSLIAHSFIAYFSGSQKLLEMIRQAPEGNWSYFLLVSFVTALLMFNFGWFREQFCIIMCPYGRFQNVLMDKHSMTVTYHKSRGEPRRNPRAVGAPTGDCISCNRCVEVCPTGIDIRNGLQMECIGCTACIDACDAIMDKVKKPRGLIFYGVKTPTTRLQFKRPRIVAYVAMLTVILGGLTYNLSTRLAFAATLLRAKDTPYQMAADGEVLNHMRLHLFNQSHRPQDFSIQLSTETAALGIVLVQSDLHHALAPGQAQEVHLFMKVPRRALGPAGTVPLGIEVVETLSQEHRTIRATGLGPAGP